MLELESVHIHYGTTEAVKGVNLVAGATEAVALIGPNGAGKTSLLRAISQLIPYEGKITFDGVDLRGHKPSDVARMGLIHVPEGRRVFPTLTVHENLLSGQTAASGRRSGYSLDDVYDLFPALQRINQREGYALSGGEQQMLAIGRALVGCPRMLLLDEPSLGLAPTIVRAVFDVLGQLSDRTPILLVEQNTVMALSRCARAYVLVTGEVRMNASAADLSDREMLLASYLGLSGAADQIVGDEVAAADVTSASPTEP
jgi:branched-chain amino acid transport system ATP-binding protein